MSYGFECVEQPLGACKLNMRCMLCGAPLIVVQPLHALWCPSEVVEGIILIGLLRCSGAPLRRPRPPLVPLLLELLEPLPLLLPGVAGMPTSSSTPPSVSSAPGRRRGDVFGGHAHTDLDYLTC